MAGLRNSEVLGAQHKIFGLGRRDAGQQLIRRANERQQAIFQRLSFPFPLTRPACGTEWVSQVRKYPVEYPLFLNLRTEQPLYVFHHEDRWLVNRDDAQV